MSADAGSRLVGLGRALHAPDLHARAATSERGLGGALEALTSAEEHADRQRCDQSVQFSMGVQCTGYVISAVHW